MSTSKLSPINSALVCDGTHTYFAQRHRSQNEPHSAATDLIQSIYETFPHKALTILRNRIFTDYPIGVMDKGMAKVAAKAIEHRENLSFEPSTAEISAWILLKTNSFADAAAAFSQSEPRAKELVFNFENRYGQKPQSKEAHHQKAMNLALRLAALIPRRLPLYQSSRPVACVLLSAENELVAWSVNTNVVNKTQHAEVNLLQAYYKKSKRGLLPGSRLYVSAKPCKMCAGMIFHCARDPRQIKVYYREEDGRLANNTALDEAQVLVRI